MFNAVSLYLANITMSNTIILGIVCLGILVLIAYSFIANFGFIRNRNLQNSDTTDSYTQKLIGEKQYQEMVKTVDKIRDKHSTDQCVVVSITAGPNTKSAERELHHLLPGQPLHLQKVSLSGMDCVDVYSNGQRVGRLMLGDADIVIKLMKSSSLTGVYVAEQNCYGDNNLLSLRIIVFHSPARRPVPLMQNPEETPYKITYSGVHEPLTIYQN